MKRILVIALAAAALVYGIDFLVLRSRSQQFGNVRVRIMYAVKLKNRQTEYFQEEPRDTSCVKSMFPQMGYPPCWYLARHRIQTIDIDSGRRDMLIHTP
jgi:hypothetical protein